MAIIALALRLGMLPSVFLKAVSSYELSVLLAYHRLSPVDDSRGDLVGGIIASTIANVNRGEKQEPYKPVEFMPFADKPNNAAAKFRAQFAHLVKRKD